MNELALIETDADGLLEALDRAVRMRRAGARFEVSFRFPNDRATVANLAARDIVAKMDASSWRDAFDDLAAYDARLGSAVLENLSTLSVAHRKTAHDLWVLADALRITSFAEYRRLMIGLDYAGPRRLHEPSDTRVPAPIAAFAGDRIAIWAPKLKTDAFLLPLAAACADGAPVDVVCAGGETYGFACTLVSPGDGASALARSGVIVSIGENPGTALALAAWLRPLCAATTSGAHLWLRGITTYRPWSRIDVERAIAIARAAAPAFERILPLVAESPRPEEAESASRVCVVVRTDGDEMSAVTTHALARVAHRHVEIVLMRPDGSLASALDETHAEFLYVLDDGDAPYPESLSRLAAALESSGDDAATGDVLATYVDDANSSRTTGYAILVPAREESTPEGVPLRTLVRCSRFREGTVVDALTIRIDAVLATALRTIDGRSPYVRALAARPNRLPGLRFTTARSISD